MGKIQEIIDSRQAPGIIGSRDTFGIKNEFYDERQGKYINNFTDWERAGFKPIDSIKNDFIREKAKEKSEKCKRRGDRKLDPRNLPL